jgi:hypothetical protein
VADFDTQIINAGAVSVKLREAFRERNILRSTSDLLQNLLTGGVFWKYKAEITLTVPASQVEF